MTPSLSNASVSSLNSVLSESLRPTKSIIVGGGKPIIIPGQINITNDPKYRSQVGNIKSNPENEKNVRISVPCQITQVTKMITVDEFCPDDGLDKSFLDDVTLSTSYTNHNSIEIVESDSDNDNSNPMVANFNDAPIWT